MKQYDKRVKFFINQIGVLSQTHHLPKTNKALKLLLAEMCAEKGFTRHDGSDYFVHPIAVAQTALDFQLVATRIRNKDIESADNLLAGCLLHDILEDVPHITNDVFKDMFGSELFMITDNVTKRSGESIEAYHDRVASHELSALIKILDRLNNVMTLSDSSHSHRSKQVLETRTHYIPLTKDFRKLYWMDMSFYWQAKLIMECILSEIEKTL